jgi:hypothetical protein
VRRQEDFRVFAVDDADKPLTKLDELHDSLGWTDLETEMKLSRDESPPVSGGHSPQ